MGSHLTLSAALLLALGFPGIAPARSSGDRAPLTRYVAVQAHATSGSSPEVEDLMRSADSYIRSGDLRRAEASLRKAVALAPDDVAALTQLGRVLSMQHRLEESITFFERALKLEPIANSPEANGSVFYLLAWCYLKEGDEETAKKIMFYAIDRFPEEPANFVDLGKLCLKDNSLEAGLEVVQRGVARHPGSGDLFELKGALESKQGLRAASVQSYREAVRLNPRSSEALLGLAVTQANLLRNRDAIATFEKGLKLFPQDARFYAGYGKVLLQPWASGEIPAREVKAEQLLERAVELDASLAMAQFELGGLLVRNQRPAEALPHLEQAAKLDAKNAQVHFILARAYRAIGRAPDAQREMVLFQKLQSGASREESAPPPEDKSVPRH